MRKMRLNQPPLQCRIMRQTLPYLASFAVLNLKLPYRTDSNAALLPYPIQQLGSAHVWSGVWNGPNLRFLELRFPSRKDLCKKLVVRSMVL